MGTLKEYSAQDISLPSFKDLSILRSKYIYEQMCLRTICERAYPKLCFQEEFMKALPDIQRASAELLRVHEELRHVENRVDAICGTLREAIADLLGSDRQALSRLAEATLATKIAEKVRSQLSIPSPLGSLGGYVRERDAARYIGDQCRDIAFLEIASL
jgi:hypothetical protein